MYELVIAGGLAAVCVLFIIKRKFSSEPTLKLPPGPSQSYILGNFKDIDTDKFHQSLFRLFKEYGPIIQLRFMKRTVVVLNSAEAIRKAFGDEKFKEHLNDKTTGFFGSYLVYGHQDVLLGPYCERTFRLKDVMHKGLGPSMTLSNMKHECEQLVDMLARHGSKDFVLAETIETLLAEVFSVLISGETKESDVEIMWEFIHWSNKLLNPSVESLMKNFPFLRLLPGKYGSLFNTARFKRDRLLTRYLDESRETYTPGINRSFVDTCLRLQQEQKGPSGDSWLTDDMIRALIMDVLGGGLIATTNTVLAAILNLLNNRKCLDKMLAEISTVLGRDQTVTPGDIKRMPYCNAVVLETQRYGSLVPITSHFCSKENIEFEGYTIEKGSMVWGNIWGAHHDEGVWKDPWVFRPERFLNERGSLLPKDHILRQSLMPLGVGSRYCVGSDFAMQRIFTYVTTIVQHFDILPPKDTELLSCDPNLYDSGAVLQIDPFKCRAIQRKNNKKIFR